MTGVQAAGHKVGPSGNYHEALPNHHLINELERLAEGNDFVRVLRRSSQLSTSASGTADPQGLVADLASFAQQGMFASLLSIEPLAAVQHPSADDQLI